ncbi:PEP-CTERM sorting domain-containing protein [bacterium]|nr:PEP-CTERM sorting domain-containing protein [bacterium]
MKYLQSFLTTGVLLCLLAGGVARAQNSNYWIGTTGGDYTNTANWSLGTAPSTTDWVFFTNGVDQTITFSSSITNYPLKIYDSSATFDLGGQAWKNMYQGTVGSTIGTNPASAMTVVFSSSSAPAITGGNTVLFGQTSPYHTDVIGATSGGRQTKVVVDDSLGNPVRVLWDGGYGGIYDVDLTVSGPGSEFRVAYGNPGSLASPNVTVSNQALLSGYSLQVGYGGYYATVTVDNASAKSDTIFSIGAYYGGLSTVILSNNSTLIAGSTVQVGQSGLAASGGNYSGKLLMDNSAVIAQTMQLGGPSHNGLPPGFVQAVNGSSLTLSNRLVITDNNTSGSTNTLILNNGTISLGGGATPGVLTNLAVMRAAGTIKGQGTSPALVYGGPASILEVGSSIGTLTLQNANLELAAGSQTLWEFSDTALDQINVINGWASLDGTNLFALAAGSAIPQPGQKWGLGSYNFVLASNITAGMNFYANMTNLLGSYGLTENLDYRFGVLNIGGGQWAMRLEFVPEPSTVLLLVGGGLVLLRFRRRGLSRLLSVLLVAVLAVSAQAQTTNYWIGASGDDYTNTTSWSLGYVPVTGEYVAFTNRTSFTVPFGDSVTNGGALIWNTGATFDLQGHIWNNGSLGYGTPGIDLTNDTPGLVVTFSSTAAPAVTGGNQALFGSDAYSYSRIGEYPYGGINNYTQVVIDDSLGYGVKVRVSGFGSMYDAGLVVSGPDSEFYIWSPNSWGTGGSILITNGATLRADYLTLGNSGAATTTVTGAKLITGSATVGGYIGQGNLHLLNGSTWTASGGVQVGYDGYALGPYRGTILMDASTATVQNVTLGGTDGNPIAPGRMIIQNGSSMTISNYLRVSEVYAGQNTALDYGNHGATNHLILANGTIYLGGGTESGSITNYGRMRMAGTVTGQGPGNFTFLNGFWQGHIAPTANYYVTNAAVLEIGGSIGQLTLNNGNLQMDPASTLLLEFGETGLDQILAQDGFAALLGSNVFSLAAGSAVPTPGVKWGLGAYDFVVATNVTWNPQYDNMTNLLGSYGLTENLDYRFGVMGIGGGLQALRLEFVPEPSTVLLLVGGGLLLWRVRRRKN